MRKSYVITVLLGATASVAASVAYEFYVKPWLAQRLQSNGGTEA